MSETPPAAVSLAALFRQPKPRVPARPAGPDLEAVTAAAWQEGYRTATEALASRIETLEAALAEAGRQRAQEADEARALANSLATAIEACLARELTTLALTIAETVLDAQIRPQTGLAATTLESLIAEAIRDLGGGRLFVHPETVEQARSLAPSGWTVIARDGLEQGAIEAEAGPTLQRATLGGRLEQLRDSKP